MTLAERAAARADEARGRDKFPVARPWWKVIRRGVSLEVFFCPPQTRPWVEDQYRGCVVEDVIR